MSLIAHRVLGHLSGGFKRLCYWRCKEPVIVIESDDWGLLRRHCASTVAAYGRPRPSATEQSESPADVAALCAVLSRHLDQVGRSGCFTLNVVVANPDYEAIKASGFSRYFDRPIAPNQPLTNAYLRGIETGALHAQFHGRSHFAIQRWLNDLQRDVRGARQLFESRCHGGLSLIHGQAWRYHSEYVDWTRCSCLSEPDRWNFTSGGIQSFRRVFGFLPHTTIAPHYIFTTETEHIWKGAAIQAVQGANYQICRSASGRRIVLHYPMGSRLAGGLLALARTLTFEPRVVRRPSDLNAVLQRAESLLRHGIPVVINTHRANYTGRFRQGSLEQLDALLRSLRRNGGQFLTSTELATAIENGGHFRDVITGKERALTPTNSSFQVSVGRLVAGLNALFSGPHAMGK